MIVTSKGYLIAKYDYDLFDEVIILLNEYGLKFTCFSKGSRKIKSKNGRSLFYGNFLEFSFFYSQSKMSRLKKVVTLSNLDEENKNKLSLWLINELYSHLKIEHQKYFQFYQEVIYLNLNNYNDYLIMLLICIKLIKWFKIIKFPDVNYQKNNKCLNLNDFTLIETQKSNDKVYKLNLEHTNALLSIFELEQISHIDITNIKIKIITLLIKKFLFLINQKLNLKINLDLI